MSVFIVVVIVVIFSIFGGIGLWYALKTIKVIVKELSNMKESIEDVIKKTNSKVNDTISNNSQQLAVLRESNENKFDRLQNSVENKLSSSFAAVTDKMETVHHGLGEIHGLAAGIGDLKNLLSNVKSRGTWGEIQLGRLLEETLTPNQYDANVIIRDEGRDAVEFVVKMPEDIVLPIDAKFPLESYQRLTDAYENCNKEEIKLQLKELSKRIKEEAKKIHNKYIFPPKTTDFAILFLPVESLYAEVLKIPGLVEQLQIDYRVIVSGPVTISALLNSLQMGFRTLAIEEKTSEAWELMTKIKTEFGKFGEMLEKVQKKLQETTNVVDQTASKARNIQSKLGKIENDPT